MQGLTRIGLTGAILTGTGSDVVHRFTAHTGGARRDIHLTVHNAKLYTLTIWEVTHAQQMLRGHKRDDPSLPLQCY